MVCGLDSSSILGSSQVGRNIGGASNDPTPQAEKSTLWQIATASSSLANFESNRCQEETAMDLERIFYSRLETMLAGTLDDGLSGRWIAIFNSESSLTVGTPAKNLPQQLVVERLDVCCGVLHKPSSVYFSFDENFLFRTSMPMFCFGVCWNHADFLEYPCVNGFVNSLKTTSMLCANLCCCIVEWKREFHAQCRRGGMQRALDPVYLDALCSFGELLKVVAKTCPFDGTVYCAHSETLDCHAVNLGELYTKVDTNLVGSDCCLAFFCYATIYHAKSYYASGPLFLCREVMVNLVRYLYCVAFCCEAVLDFYATSVCFVPNAVSNVSVGYAKHETGCSMGKADDYSLPEPLQAGTVHPLLVVGVDFSAPSNAVLFHVTSTRLVMSTDVPFPVPSHAGLFDCISGFFYPSNAERAFYAILMLNPLFLSNVGKPKRGTCGVPSNREMHAYNGNAS